MKRHMQGTPQTRKLGRMATWAIIVICILYAATLLIGGVVRGVPREPYFAIAEILTMLSAVVLVILSAAIHECAPGSHRIYSLMGLGWMFVLAGITISVHLAELTVGRQLDDASKLAFARLFDFEWPSLLYAIEFVAWHVGFGLSVLFSAFAFQGDGAERVVRRGFITVGVLCLIGLIGPAIGNLNWRLIGVFAYAILFPVVCIWLVRVFKEAE